MDSDEDAYEENINLAEGEDEFLPITEIMNIFNVYYNKKYNIKGNLFSGTNPFNKHSINERMIEFLDEIRLYKLIINPLVSVSKEIFNNFNSSNPTKLYELKIINGAVMYNLNESASYNDDIIFYSDNLIALMLKLSEFEWVDMEWTLT